jgi:hypothetical protein
MLQDLDTEANALRADAAVKPHDELGDVLPRLAAQNAAPVTLVQNPRGASGCLGNWRLKISRSLETNLLVLSHR